MPTVSIDKQDLYEYLGRNFTTKEFTELCFEFGIELEEDTTEELAERLKNLSVEERKVAVEERPQLKIDIPANRYDLLCFEGISRALKIYLEEQELPKYHKTAPKDVHRMIVHPDTAKVRPYIVCAILRGVRFTPSIYQSFIDLQEKLHNNICRHRTLASIGTHDLGTIKGPFRYEAKKPEDIVFVPLNQTELMDGRRLMEFYESDLHLRKYLPIIRDSALYPVVYDAEDHVLSLPPIINSNHSRITLDTRDVLIECTATSLTKANIVLNTVVAMFSQYCAEPFSVEPVVVEIDGRKEVYPEIEPRNMVADVEYINQVIGVNLTPEEIMRNLKRMSVHASPSSDGKQIEILVPPTRSDLLGPCDIVEDVAIAFGYNNIPRGFIKSSTIGGPLPINKLTDIVRREAAMAGWTEILTLSLCSHDENFGFLGRKDGGDEAVVLANPKTFEYQVARTLLLPGALKTIRENRKHALPMRIFEVSDVVLKDPTMERMARNERHFCAVFTDRAAQFEVVQGLLDRVMQMLCIPHTVADSTEPGYFLEQIDLPTFFPGRSAQVYFRKSRNATPTVLGQIGILHPDVLGKFELIYPCSAVEINIQPFL
ncbi:phenylalanine--tRNA ligase subunit beta [Spiromyces aspiralis]|uniref:Phenylalanine--tRNA ligase subunit beta n=1 Tax=Spiromyces aspiralis TaxID=68401 RepID=A0ACC1HI08_9FUNG|nr:phenylalanine--tRNA ligase subunit beta [Spiromyces aspiralis]